jgi:hypothetical protein
MSKTLFLPDHVAQKINKEREAGEKLKLSSVKSAYVNAADRVLDPALLDTSLMERLPQPTGWRLLGYAVPRHIQNKGGLHIPDEIRTEKL